MQLNDVSDAHRPFLAEVVPDGAVHDIDVNDSTATYDVWVVHAGWVHHATVTITDPRTRSAQIDPAGDHRPERNPRRGIGPVDPERHGRLLGGQCHSPGGFGHHPGSGHRGNPRRGRGSGGANMTAEQRDGDAQLQNGQYRSYSTTLPLSPVASWLICRGAPIAPDTCGDARRCCRCTLSTPGGRSSAPPGRAA